MFDFAFGGFVQVYHITRKDADLDLVLGKLEQKINQQQPNMRQSSMEQYFAQISSSYKI